MTLKVCTFYYLLKGEWGEFHWASSGKRVTGKMQTLIPGKSTNSALQIIRIGSNSIPLVPLELLTDRCARDRLNDPDRDVLIPALCPFMGLSVTQPRRRIF